MRAAGAVICSVFLLIYIDTEAVSPNMTPLPSAPLFFPACPAPQLASQAENQGDLRTLYVKTRGLALHTRAFFCNIITRENYNGILFYPVNLLHIL